MALLRTNTGIGTTNPTSALHVIGDALVTGIVTATTFNGNINAGVATITTSNVTNLSNTRLVSGIGTIGQLNSNSAVIGTGIVTSISGTNLNYSGIGTIETLDTTTGSIDYLTSTNLSVGGISTISNLYVTGISTFIGVGTFSGDLYVGGDLYVTDDIVFDELSARNLNINGIGTIPILDTTTGSIDYLSGTNISYSGVGTITTLYGTDITYVNLNANNAFIDVGIVTNLSGTNLNYSGVGTANTLYSTTSNIQNANIVTGIVTNLSGSDLNYSGIGTINALNSTNSTLTNINSSGIATLTDVKANRINTTGIVTASSFVPSSGYIKAPDGTNSFYIYSGTGNVAFQGTIGASQINNAQGYKVIGFNGIDNVTFENDVYTSGITTSIGGFVGNLTGIAASATRLVTPRTFEITGDIVASPVIFDGTGNVSLAATIQPNSVALGSDTTGDYVQSISGTSNQITVTSGTGESSTPTLSIPTQFTVPQDITVTRDLQVNRNLNVNGTITIGGTSAFINVEELKVTDPDLVLGFRTDTFGNDISNDTTANHGGIAIASTEGTPLISLYDVGIGETNPATYKKIMWFKSGTFSGLGTDAWLINYAVGIGSTQFPDGTRLAAGAVQFTERDLAVVRNIRASGIITAAGFVGGPISASEATFVNVYSSGVTTAFGGFVGNLTGNLNSSGINTADVIGGTTLNYSTGNLTTGNIVSGVVTTIIGSDLSYARINANNGYINSGIITNVSGTYLNYSGIGTIETLDTTTGTIDTLSGNVLTYSTGNLNTANVVVGIITTLSGTTATYSTGNFNTGNIVTGIITNITSNSLTNTGVATFTNGPVFIGSGSSTGTGSQTLQVTGGAYISGNTGIGSTNPTSKLTVDGDGLFVGVVTAAGFNVGPVSGSGANFTSLYVSGITTSAGGFVGNLTGNVNSSGISTVTTLFGTTVNYNTANIVTGIVTNLSGTNLNYSGIGTINILQSTNSTLTNINSSGIATLTDVRLERLVVSGITTTSGLNVGTGGTVITTTLGPSRVGINSIVPQYTLDIGGDINFSGQIYRNGNIFTSGIGIRSDSTIITGTGTTILNFVGTAVSAITANVAAGIATIFLERGQFTRTTSAFTATENKTTFPINYTPGYIDVYINGVRLTSSEYTATNGTSIVLATPCLGGETVDITVFQDDGLYSGSKWTPGNGNNIYRLDGNVGIGTDNITSKLTVNGDALFTGIVTAAGFNSSNATFTNLNVSGVTTSLNLNATNSTLTNINSSGIATFVRLNTTNEYVSGISTIATLNVGVAGTVITTTSNGRIGLSSTSPNSVLDVEGNLGVETTVTDISTTSASTIDSMSSTVFRSAKFQVQITQGSSYQSSDIMVVHDGTNASLVEYGTVATGDYLGSFSALVSGGSLLLQVSMTSDTSATVKVARYGITV